jgi:SRSO17 transposase
MTKRCPCPSAPGPLEAYAAEFDALFGTLSQRRGFREYLQGLLLPRDRNKTLTALVGAEPVLAAQAGGVQRLQFFLSESGWDAEAINTRRLALLLNDPATVAHADGVLVIDDTGDRKAGTQTAHVARQWLGSVGKVDKRHCGRQFAVGRRTGLLPVACATLRAGAAISVGQQECGVPDQAAAGAGADRRGVGRERAVPRSGRRLCCGTPACRSWSA